MSVPSNEIQREKPAIVPTEIIWKFRDACEKDRFPDALKMLEEYPGLKREMAHQLHRAIRSQRAVEALFYLDQGQDPNAVVFFRTPLQYACEQGWKNELVELIEELLKRGADVNACRPQSNDPPIVTAFDRGNLKVINVLMAHHPLLPPKVFDIAYRGQGNLELIKILLDQTDLTPEQNDDHLMQICRQLVVNPNEKMDDEKIRLIQYSIDRVLARGAGSDPATIEKALEITKNHDAVCVQLGRHLEKLADDAQEIANGRIRQHGAENDRRAARLLLRQTTGTGLVRDALVAHCCQLRNAAPGQYDHGIAFDDLTKHILSHRDNPNYLYALYYQFILPDAEKHDRHPKTPFYWAAAAGLMDDVNIEFPPEDAPGREEELTAAFDAACQFGRLEVVKLLLERGIKPTQHSLAYAATPGHLEVVELLLQHGAPTTAALYNACKWSKDAVVKRLLQEPTVDVNEEVDGKTALVIACENRSRSTVLAILEVHPECQEQHAFASKINDAAAPAQQSGFEMEEVPMEPRQQDFSEGKEYLEKIKDYVDSRFKSKKFPRGNLKYQVLSYVLDQLNKTDHWENDVPYTKVNLHQKSVNITGLINSGKISEFQIKLLKGKKFMSLDEALNLQRYYVTKSESRAYKKFH